jgi:hypothetical protein
MLTSSGTIGSGLMNTRNLKAATYTGQHKRRINADRHPCLEWDWNPRSQCSSERRHFMP